VATIGVNATVASGGDWVNASWAGFEGDNYSSDCWVGLFAPVGIAKIHAIKSGGFPYTAPYASTAPIKFISCHEGRQQPGRVGSGSYSFHLHNYRQDVFFALFDKGLEHPFEIARSAPVHMANASAPMHLRLALSKEPGQIQVGWTSSHPGSVFVQYGYTTTTTTTTTATLPFTAKAFSVSTYGAGDLCGAPASADGWFDPGFAFYAHVPPTEDGMGRRCTYRVGSDASGWSDVHSFFQPPCSPKQPSRLQIMLTADVGATEVDGAHYHWEEPDAGLTYACLFGSFVLLLHPPHLSQPLPPGAVPSVV
jgi:hypothetical protein